MTTFDYIIEHARENYSRFYSFDTTVVVDGAEVDVTLHWVGHNATHRFAIGQLADGRFFRRSVDTDVFWDDAEGIFDNIVPDDMFPGYIGHY